MSPLHLWNSFLLFVFTEWVSKNTSLGISMKEIQNWAIFPRCPSGTFVWNSLYLLVMWITGWSWRALSSCSRQELDEHALMRFSKASLQNSISLSLAKNSNDSRSSASTTAFRLNTAFESGFTEKTLTRTQEVTSLASIKISTKPDLLALFLVSILIKFILLWNGPGKMLWLLIWILSYQGKGIHAHTKVKCVHHILLSSSFSSFLWALE